jgi:hypothetical protein
MPIVHNELSNILRLADIKTVINALQTSVVPVDWLREGIEEDGFALLLSLYCRALVPSIASKDLFGNFVKTRQEASLLGLCNNVILPDNLLVTMVDGKQVGIVADREIVTAPATLIPERSGKVFFYPFSYGKAAYADPLCWAAWNPCSMSLLIARKMVPSGQDPQSGMSALYPTYFEAWKRHTAQGYPHEEVQHLLPIGRNTLLAYGEHSRLHWNLDWIPMLKL